jgi:hypothetical protein
VAVDFRLTASQRELQLRSRKFAKEVLAPAIEAETRRKGLSQQGPPTRQ